MIKKIGSIFKGGNIVLTKTVIGWLAGGAISFVNIVFYFGVSSANKSNVLNELKELVIQNHNDNIELKNTFKDFTVNVKDMFTKVYNDQYNGMIDYQNYSKKQLSLILEYGLTNKKLMKDILDMNHTEENNKLKKEAEKNKDETISRLDNIANNKKGYNIKGIKKDIIISDSTKINNTSGVEEND